MYVAFEDVRGQTPQSSSGTASHCEVNLPDPRAQLYLRRHWKPSSGTKAWTRPYFYFYFILFYFLIVVQVQRSPFPPHHSPPPQLPPPPNFDPTPLSLCPCVLYTCSLMTLPTNTPNVHSHLPSGYCLTFKIWHVVPGQQILGNEKMRQKKRQN